MKKDHFVQVNQYPALVFFAARTEAVAHTVHIVMTCVSLIMWLYGAECITR